jgi:hypothetical protein
VGVEVLGVYKQQRCVGGDNGRLAQVRLWAAERHLLVVARVLGEGVCVGWRVLGLAAVACAWERPLRVCHERVKKPCLTDSNS